MTTQEELLKALKKLWPNVVFEKVMHESNEIHGNAVSFNTPYEQPEPNRRVLRQMEEVFDQILTDMYRCWPSKADELRARGDATCGCGGFRGQRRDSPPGAAQE
jgi:hypothetical protein